MYSLAFFQETQNIDTVLSKNVRQKKKNSEVKWGGKWVSARILLKNDNKMFLDAIEVDINGIIIKLPDININPDKETKYLKKKVIHHNIDEEIADLPNITEEATQGLKEDILVSIDENNKSLKKHQLPSPISTTNKRHQQGLKEDILVSIDENNKSFKKRQLPSPIATTNKRHQQNFHNISTDDDDYLSNTYESVLQTNKIQQRNSHIENTNKKRLDNNRETLPLLNEGLKYYTVTFYCKLCGNSLLGNHRGYMTKCDARHSLIADSSAQWKKNQRHEIKNSLISQQQSNPQHEPAQPSTSSQHAEINEELLIIDAEKETGDKREEINGEPEEEYVQYEILHDEEYETNNESEKITNDDKAGEKMFDIEDEEMVDKEKKIIINEETEKITNEPEKIVDEEMDEEEYVQYKILHDEEYEINDDKAGEKIFDKEAERMVDEEKKKIINEETEKITNEPEKIVDEMMDDKEYEQSEILHNEEDEEESKKIIDQEIRKIILEKAEKKIAKKFEEIILITIKNIFDKEDKRIM
ncbi:hypothetical protein HCN44_000328 [Aphidius gifuensis]|uniref:Uncharacterized protein n=1 Tax=Aphidius gifuensis TaxID=684658 RepID=A0A834XNE1_APHGI|nr:hypothetical protein HCN44_000328 [Aphidius gifuensis]